MLVINNDSNENNKELVDETKQKDSWADLVIDVTRDLINSALSDWDLYGIINILSKINHPASIAFFTWLKRNQENIIWYSAENLEKIELVHNGIKIFWNTIDLQNEEAESDWKNIFKVEWKTYFKHNSIWNYLESVWKKLVDFEEISKFLPWDIENKIDFFVSVLWLDLFWYYNSNGNSCLNRWGWYWSKAESLHSPKAIKIAYNKSDDLDFPIVFDQSIACTLRCAKK